MKHVSKYIRVIYDKLFIHRIDNFTMAKRLLPRDKPIHWDYKEKFDEKNTGEFDKEKTKEPPKTINCVYYDYCCSQNYSRYMEDFFKITLINPNKDYRVYLLGSLYKGRCGDIFRANIYVYFKNPIPGVTAHRTTFYHFPDYHYFIEYMSRVNYSGCVNCNEHTDGSIYDEIDKIIESKFRENHDMIRCAPRYDCVNALPFA